MQFLRLVGAYWNSRSHRGLAWLLTGLLAVLIIGGVYLQSRINIWNARFFDALEKKASRDLEDLLWQFAGLVLAAGAIMVVTVFVRMTFQLRIREFVSKTLVSHWLSQGNYRRLDHRIGGAQTPEFRISDDVRLGVDNLFDLAVGFSTCILLGVTFFEVLARVGGGLRIDSLGITVPAYFLIGAVVYAFLMSGLASLVGWSLISQISAKNHFEGMFRYELTRVRENGRATVGRSESWDKLIITRAIEEVVGAWRRVMVGQSRVSGIASANAVLVGVFPVLLATPKYVSGELSLGAVMQLATAFVQVQMALNWIVDNFVRFAEWRASANRVGELAGAIAAVGDAPEETAFEPVQAGLATDEVLDKV